MQQEEFQSSRFLFLPIGLRCAPPHPPLTYGNTLGTRPAILNQPIPHHIQFPSYNGQVMKHVFIIGSGFRSTASLSTAPLPASANKNTLTSLQILIWNEMKHYTAFSLNFGLSVMRTILVNSFLVNLVSPLYLVFVIPNNQIPM